MGAQDPQLRHDRVKIAVRRPGRSGEGRAGNQGSHTPPSVNEGAGPGKFAFRTGCARPLTLREKK